MADRKIVEDTPEQRAKAALIKAAMSDRPDRELSPAAASLRVELREMVGGDDG